MSAAEKKRKRELQEEEPKKKKLTKIKKNHNKKITDILAELAVIEKNRGEIYKAKAYRTAIQTLSHLDHEVKSGEDLQNLKGIGKKIAKKIEEILKSGSLKKLENELKDERTIAFSILSKIEGVGPQTAKKLIDEYGIRTIEDLKKSKKVKLNHHQQIGLKYYDEFQKRIPRGEIELLEKEIKRIIHTKLDKNIMITICGSYRRGHESSGDIDVLITQEKTHSKCKDKYNLLEKVVHVLEKEGFLTDRIALGKTKYSGVCILPDRIKEYKPHLHRRIDIRFICHDQYYTGLLYFTGSDFLNNQMRQIAHEKGYKLSEYAITKQLPDKSYSDPLPVTSEKDVFDYLGMEYLEPEERDL